MDGFAASDAITELGRVLLVSGEKKNTEKWGEPYDSGTEIFLLGALAKGGRKEAVEKIQKDCLAERRQQEQQKRRNLRKKG